MMHPRNIYNTPPNFEELASTYPEFQKISQLDISGKIKLDFKNPHSVRTLSKCCLHKDFDLQVELPPEKLLPTIPLRLNYLLWLEDLLRFSEIDEEIKGVDIGCGASCVYCLLAVRLNPTWSMFGLEIDEENIKYAQENLSRNFLESKITVIAQDNNLTLFGKLFQLHPGNKSFCMCNPPFYNSKDEVCGENRTGKRKAPKSFHSGSTSELVTEGGELGFVKKILAESMQLQEKILIYSTMLGCKKTLQKILDELRINKIESFTTTEFVQGKTMRWGVAWSFNKNLTTFKDHNKLPKTTKTISTTISTSNFEDVTEKIREIFNTLQIEIKEIANANGKCHRWELAAHQNTWSNQRRKRRAQIKESVDENISKEDVKIGFEVRGKTNSAEIQMYFISGSMNKDCVNQIMQFLKNSIK